MILRSIRSWWLLAVAALQIAIAALFFQNAGRGFVFHSTLPLIGRLGLAAGACTVAAAVRAAPRDWMLLANGLAIGVFGLAISGVFGSRITFRFIALLMLVSALSLAFVAWKTGRALLVSAGVLALFALAFAGMTITGIRPSAGSSPELLLFGSFFACHALSVLALCWMSLQG